MRRPFFFNNCLIPFGTLNQQKRHIKLPIIQQFVNRLLSACSHYNLFFAPVCHCNNSCNHLIINKLFSKKLNRTKHYIKYLPQIN